MTGNIVFDAGQPTGNSALVPAAGTVWSLHFNIMESLLDMCLLISDLSGTPTIPSAVGGANGVDFNDDVKARFGTGNDLEIYHDRK